MIKLQDQVLFVHPLPSHLAKDYGQQNGGGHAHVVYRHPSDDATNAKRSCHTEGKTLVVGGLSRSGFGRSELPSVFRVARKIKGKTSSSPPPPATQAKVS